MSKFTCFVVLVVSLSYLCTGEGVKSAAEYEALREECLKESGNTEDDFKEIMETGDMTNINTCYFGCYFKKIGLLNDKGQYDPTIYLRDLKEIIDDSAYYAQLKEVTVKCESVKDEAVSDGEAGCEMGALVAACLYKEEKLLYSSHLAQN